jgi:hypothetical protein
MMMDRPSLMEFAFIRGTGCPVASQKLIPKMREQRANEPRNPMSCRRRAAKAAEYAMNFLKQITSPKRQ